LGLASSASASAGRSIGFGATFSPVHSKKAPHLPQNESPSWLWKPQLLQTIIRAPDHFRRGEPRRPARILAHAEPLCMA
jgi:hypothetical protein